MFNSHGLRFNFSHESALTRRYTECFVLNKEGKTVGHGVATCHPHDRFERSKGRKIALASALQSMCFAKEERSQVWTDYFKMVKHV